MNWDTKHVIIELADHQVLFACTQFRCEIVAYFPWKQLYFCTQTTSTFAQCYVYKSKQLHGDGRMRFDSRQGNLELFLGSCWVG